MLRHLTFFFQTVFFSSVVFSNLKRYTSDFSSSSFFLNVFSALKATLPYFFKNGLEARLWINNGRLIPLVGHLLPVCSRFVFS